jgi:hypothetical protein
MRSKRLNRKRTPKRIMRTRRPKRTKRTRRPKRSKRTKKYSRKTRRSFIKKSRKNKSRKNKSRKKNREMVGGMLGRMAAVAAGGVARAQESLGMGGPPQALGGGPRGIGDPFVDRMRDPSPSEVVQQRHARHGSRIKRFHTQYLDQIADPNTLIYIAISDYGPEVTVSQYKTDLLRALLDKYGQNLTGVSLDDLLPLMKINECREVEPGTDNSKIPPAHYGGPGDGQTLFDICMPHSDYTKDPTIILRINRGNDTGIKLDDSFFQMAYDRTKKMAPSDPLEKKKIPVLESSKYERRRQKAAEKALEEREAQRRNTVIISVHDMTSSQNAVGRKVNEYTVNKNNRIVDLKTRIAANNVIGGSNTTLAAAIFGLGSVDNIDKINLGELKGLAEKFSVSFTEGETEELTRENIILALRDHLLPIFSDKMVKEIENIILSKGDPDGSSVQWLDTTDGNRIEEELGQGRADPPYTVYLNYKVTEDRRTRPITAATGGDSP